MSELLSHAVLWWTSLSVCLRPWAMLSQFTRKLYPRKVFLTFVTFLNSFPHFCDLGWIPVFAGWERGGGVGAVRAAKVSHRGMTRPPKQFQSSKAQVNILGWQHFPCVTTHCCWKIKWTPMWLHWKGTPESTALVSTWANKLIAGTSLDIKIPKFQTTEKNGCKTDGLKIQNGGLPWWRSGWESACQCRGHGFEPRSGKIPHAAEQLGPWATAAEPACLEPVLRNKRGRDSERRAHRDEEWPPLSATGESPRTETKTQHSQK